MALDAHVEQTLEGIFEEASLSESGKPGSAHVPGAPSIPASLVEGASGGHTMDLLDTYSGEQISSSVIFAEEGLQFRSRRQMAPQYAKKLGIVAKFLKEVYAGRQSMERLQEAMMSSEFTALLGDTLDRILLAKYASYDPTYRQFMRTRTVRDFRAVGSVRRHGGRGLQAVAEGETYPQAALQESDYSYSVSKYGQTYELTWEMFINDDLDAFRDLPNDMADDAIQEEMRFASSLYVANATLYDSAHAVGSDTFDNTGTAALALASLEAAFNTMLGFPGDTRKDGEVKPINNMAVYLVIPPVLWLTALKILGSMQVQWSGGDASSSVAAVAYPTNNALTGRLTVIQDPYIPIIDPTNGPTSWYLFSEPSRIHAVEVGFLRGYEQPQVFERSPNARRLGGGENAMDGDFNNDGRGYKIRHVFGGSHANATGGWRGTYFSDGTS